MTRPGEFYHGSIADDLGKLEDLDDVEVGPEDTDLDVAARILARLSNPGMQMLKMLAAQKARDLIDERRGR